MLHSVWWFIEAISASSLKRYLVPLNKKKKLLRSKKAHCVVKQKEQEAIQSKQLLRKMVRRAENKIEGQISKVKKTNNHFSIFKGQVQNC